MTVRISWWQWVEDVDIEEKMETVGEVDDNVEMLMTVDRRGCLIEEKMETVSEVDEWLRKLLTVEKNWWQ